MLGSQQAFLRDRIEELEQFYMPIDLDTKHHLLKKIAVKKLTYILDNTTRQELQAADIKEVVSCTLSTIYYFGMHLKMFTFSLKSWFSERHFNRADIAFKRVLEHLLPEKNEAAIVIILQYFSTNELWPHESFICHTLNVVLFYSRGETTLYDHLLSDVHAAMATDVKGARHRMRVLYELLKSQHWSVDRILPFINRLLECFACTISVQTRTNSQLRKGFEVCLRRIIERVNNEYRLTIIKSILQWLSTTEISADSLAEMSSVLEYPASLYTADFYSDSIDQTLLDKILQQLVLSTDHTYSLIGCRLLHLMLDRQRNSSYLFEPIIFYEFLQVGMCIRKYERRDKAFIREYRELIHNSLMTAVKMNRERMLNMKAIYTIIGCLVLEVPCGITAAAVSCLVMEIQQFALHEDNLSPSTRYRLHGIVAAVMSLICWVHKAPVLYQYVNSVIANRARESPQLNPPLKDSYDLAHQHVNWNKPAYFFEDWELRYGLWKHFRNVIHKPLSKTKQ